MVADKYDVLGPAYADIGTELLPSLAIQTVCISTRKQVKAGTDTVCSRMKEIRSAITVQAQN